MQAVRKASVFAALIFVSQFAFATFATAASYVATSVGADLVLRNHNGTLVFRKTISPGTSNEFTAITVSRGGTPAELYTDGPGVVDSPAAISDSEIIVGVRVVAGGQPHAVILSNGAATDIHAAVSSALGFDAASAKSFATGVNNAGQVVGTISNTSGTYAFHYKEGVAIDLGAIAGTRLTAASAINNFGQILVSGPILPAGIYSGGAITALTYVSSSDTRPTTLTGYAINDAGQVTGKLAYSNGLGIPQDINAFLYQGGAVQDIGYIGHSVFTNPREVNDAGNVLGAVFRPHGPSRAFLYSNGVMTDLTDVTDAASLNNHFISDAISVSDDGVIFAKTDAGQPVLLTPTPSAAVDPAIFSFEAGAQGWLSSGEPIITVAASTAVKFAGEQSLGIQFNQSGFASVRALNPTVKPGHTISFHIYIPATSKIEWVQPYAQGNAADEWAWQGNWTSIGDLQLGAWNTLTVSIPADAHPLHSIGLELFASEPDPGIVYLDSVDYGATPDTAQFSFETGAQGWESDGDPIAAVGASDAQPLAGKKSLAITINGTGLARVSTPNPSVHAGQTLSFHVYIPTDAHIDSVQPFALEGAEGNWAWHGNWQPISALQTGAWNTITVNVPTGAQPIAALGIELSSSQTDGGTVFVDSVK